MDGMDSWYILILGEILDTIIVIISTLGIIIKKKRSSN